MTPRTLTALALAGLLTADVSAQFQSQNVTLLDNMPLSQFSGNPDSGNDCWGYVSPSGREYALMGLSNSIAVVEITNPTNPVIVQQITHPNSLWGDIKVYQDHCYVSNEEGGGIQVISLANVDNGQVTLVRSVTGSGLQTTHNVAVDETSGFLYLAGANINGGSIVAYDLSNPGNPVLAGTFSGPYSHDLQIVTYTEGPYAGRQVAFCSNGSTAFDIVDVTNKSNMFRVGRNRYPGLEYCHQGWLTEDRQYFILNDELDEANGYTNVTLTRVFDVSDITNPVLAATFSSDRPAIDHNLYVRGDFCFQANYRSGLRIFDVSDPLNAVQTGWFDTYPANDGLGFDGAWSVYPFFPSGTVIVSDINRGLFILDVSDALVSLDFSYPQGQPELISPAGGTTMRVDVAPRVSDPEPDSGTLHVNDGSGWQTYAMTDLGNSQYLADFPAVECGDTVQYYVSAETTTGQTLYDPPGAPVDTFTTLSAGSLDVFFSDDFQTNQGWTVQNTNVAEGAWVRGDPSGNGSRGDPTQDSDGSGLCYITGNGPDEDLDGGPTHLLSPIFDLTGADNVLMTVDRWFYNDDGDEDRLDIAVSSNGGGAWITMKSISHSPGWTTEAFRLTDYITLTDQVRFRFSATDNPNNSVTEAGIDAFRLQTIDCGSGGGLALAVTGACVTTGGGNFAWSGAQPSTTLALIFARNTGSFVVPDGSPCAGTTLGLGSSQIQLATTFGSGAGGSGDFNATIPQGACLGYFQLLQLTDCATSNVAQGP